MVEVTGLTTLGIIKTAIVSAFSLATAFIWRDVIIEAIEVVFPAQELLFKFLAAVVSTIIVIIAIYVFLKTEKEAEIVVEKIKHANKLKKIKP